MLIRGGITHSFIWAEISCKKCFISSATVDDEIDF